MTLDKEITEFLVARLDEFDAWAQAADDEQAVREIKAIRWVLGHLQRLEEKVLDANLWTVTEVEGIQKALAAIWSDHPDYRTEWSEDQ